MFEATNSVESSVLGLQKAKSAFPSTKELNFRESKLRLPLVGIPSKALLQALSIDTDKIICSFFMALVHLFAALEEADYQVLSATKKLDDDNLIEDNSWSIYSLIRRRKIR